MKILEAISPYANFLPSIESKELERDFLEADINFPAKKYLSLAILLSLIFALYFMLFFALLSVRELPILSALFLLSFALSLLLLKSYPKFLKRRRAELFESDLPLVLRALAVQLNMNMQFEQCIKNIAEGNYRISPEFRRVHNEIKAGASVPQALTFLSETIDSLSLKRAVNQLILAYEQGTKGDALKKIADELISTQLARTREFSSRMAFFGLAYVAAACLLPAFFEIFIIVGSLFLGLSLTPFDIWLAFLFLFPFLSALILFYIQLKSPPSLAQRLSLGDEISQVSSFLKSKGIGLSFTQLAALCVGAALLATASLVLLSLLLPSLLPLAFLIFLSPILAYFYILYLIEKRTQEMERFLPDALFHAASLQKGVSLEKIISSIAKTDYGPLSEEFAIAGRQIKAGASVPSALKSLSSRTHSILVERAINLILQGYHTGADIYYALRETAEDILSFFALIRERRASLALQKYTLLIGGAILVPIILGTVINVVSGFATAALSFFSPQEELFKTSALATQFYLVIYSSLTSILIAQQEGEPKKFLLYFLFLAPLTYLLFNLASSMNLFAFLK